MRVFIAAGEVSGDAAGAWLARALKARVKEIELWGIGGHRMATAGVDLGAATNHLGTVGVSEALVTLPSLWGVFKAVRCRVTTTPPDVAVLIGNDVFNVGLARWLRVRGIPTVSFFPPQVWVWGALAAFTTTCFDRILTCFPTEQEVYGRAAAFGTPVTFVGHFLAEQLAPRTEADKAAARQQLGIANDVTTIALLPGSRTYEVERLAPILFGAARRLCNHFPATKFLVPLAEPDFGPAVMSECSRHGLADNMVVGGTSLDAMRASDLVITASGTASLEAALLCVPMVIVYKISAVTDAIVKTAIRFGLMSGYTAGLPNLILGRPTVPEFKQEAATPEAIATEALSILDNRSRMADMVSSLSRVSQSLHGGASLERATEAILSVARRA